ncbi:MAG: glycosyltransferase family 1 protein [Planctomycetota bacterium]|jgi:glycosyltransferase involved in cell wall biosynthesis|nr:glycosyltransferase family 1 protein [Planctomycetota bacterium]MDP6955402.1 glycosyltransferase family 1 protein [Planctomycetota bacterium]
MAELDLDTAGRAPRLLVSGLVLGQPAGGVRRHNAQLLPRLAKRLTAAGGALAVLEGRAPIPFPLPDCVERLRCRVPAGPVPLRAAGEGPALRRALARAADGGRPFDAVHLAHLPVPRSLAVPRTHTIHDLRALEGADTPAHRKRAALPILHRALGGAAQVFTVSETMANRLRELFDLPANRLTVLPNGTDHLQVKPRSAGSPTPSETAGYLLHIGHLEPRKNLGLLLEALACEPSLPPLVLAGAAKGSEGERLQQLARKLGVAERVIFHGPFEERELPDLYAAAGCLALPSRLEGFGIPVAEAQAAGVPVAVARTPALLEVAGSGVPSFPVDDGQACAQALGRALETERAVLDAAGARALARTWDGAADKWFAALRGLRAGS